MNYIEDFSAALYPGPLLRRVLEVHRQLLQDLCFRDNEYGDSLDAEARVVLSMNTLLKRRGRKVRILSATPCPRKHHRIVFAWTDLTGKTADGSVTISIYPKSRRIVEDDAESEEPSRGDR